MKTNCHPATRRHTNSVPFNRINKIKVLGVIIWIKIPKPFSNNIEIEAMEMERVALCTQNASALHHYLHICVKWKHYKLGTIGNKSIIWWGPCVVEWMERRAWKIRGVNPIWFFEKIGLKECCWRESHGDVVNRSWKFRAIRPLTCLIFWARVVSQTNREEKFLVHCLRDINRELKISQTAKFSCEIRNSICSINRRKGWFKSCRVWRSFILEYPCNSCVVKCALASKIWSC